MKTHLVKVYDMHLRHIFSINSHVLVQTSESSGNILLSLPSTSLSSIIEENSPYLYLVKVDPDIDLYGQDFCEKRKTPLSKTL